MPHFEEWSDLSLDQRADLRKRIFIELERAEDGLTAASIGYALERAGYDASVETIGKAIGALLFSGAIYGTTTMSFGDNLVVWRAKSRVTR